MSTAAFLPTAGRVANADSEANRAVDLQRASRDMSVDLNLPPREDSNDTHKASSNAALPSRIRRTLLHKSKISGTSDSRGQQAKIIACYFQAMMTGWNGE